MALVRKRRLDSEAVVKREEPVFSTNPFGSRSEVYNEHAQGFIFTQNHNVIDGYLRPAVDLAKQKNLFSEFDSWSHTALDAILNCTDIHSKKLLWIVLLGMLPEVQLWFHRQAGATSERWTAGLYDRTRTFLLGACVDERAVDEEIGKRQRGGAKEEKDTLIFGTPMDFLFSEFARYFATIV